MVISYGMKRHGMKRPGGRRPGNSGTREAILAAAREGFAERGYAGTTIRAVASAADVDPALVLHYFGTKDDLFAACLTLPPEMVARMPAAFDGDPSTVGERVTRAYLSLWEEAETKPVMLSVVRSAVSHEAAARLLREFAGSLLLAPAADRLHVDAPELRVALASAQLVGLALARYVVRIDPIAHTDLDDLVAAVAPSVQRYLTSGDGLGARS